MKGPKGGGGGGGGRAHPPQFLPSWLVAVDAAVGRRGRRSAVRAIAGDLGASPLPGKVMILWGRK